MTVKTPSLIRLLAITFFSFALTLHANTMEPAVLGHKILELAPQHRNTALGLLTFAGLVVAMLAQPVVGALSDRTRSRLGRRLPYLIGGTALLVACIFTVALAPTLLILVLFVLLMQASSNTIQGPWQALIPDQVPSTLRGRASSYKTLFEIIAALVGRLSAGFLISRFPTLGDLAVIQTVGVPAVVLVFACALTAWATREHVENAQSLPAQSLWEALRGAFTIDLRRYPAFGWWFVNRLLFWCAFICLTVFLLFFTVDVFGMSEVDAQRYVAQVSVVLGAAVVVATLPAGWISDRIGRKPLIGIGGVMAAAGTFGIVLLRDLTAMTIISVFVGFGVGLFMVSSWALITDIVPRHEAARYLGMANIATAGGSALGRLLGGVLIDWLNTLFGSVSAGYLILYALAAVFFAVSVIALMPLRVPARQSLHAVDSAAA